MIQDPEDFLEEVSAPRPRHSFLAERPSKRAFVFSSLYAMAAAVVSVLSWRSEVFEDRLVGNPEKIFSGGEWYRLVTSLFLHADIAHLLANMLFLVPFGGLLTFYFGWRVFPVLGIVLGIVAQFLSLKTYAPNMNLLGSSGLLYVLFGLWLSLYYRAESHLTRGRRLMRILGFGLAMLVPSQVERAVSYRTHYIGLALGLAAGIVYGFFWKSSRRRPHTGT